MSQVTDFTIPGSPLTMLSLKSTLEAAFAALGSFNRGATAPANPFEGMFWWDSSANPEILKRYTVTGGWATILSINITTGALSINPAGIDDASANETAMQTTADPYPGSSASLATTLSGELQRLRYIVQQITGMAQWYHDPVDTIWLPASMMTALTTAGAAAGATEFATNDIMVSHFAFDDEAEEFVSVNLVMPHDWNLGTVKAKFYWVPASADGSPTDTVEWKIAAGALSNDDAIDAAPGTAQVISDAVLTGENGDLHVSGATPALTIGGTPALGDMIHFKISRNVGGTDSLAYDAHLVGVLLQYTKGSTAGAAW